MKSFGLQVLFYSGLQEQWQEYELLFYEVTEVYLFFHWRVLHRKWMDTGLKSKIKRYTERERQGALMKTTCSGFNIWNANWKCVGESRTLILKNTAIYYQIRKKMHKHALRISGSCMTKAFTNGQLKWCTMNSSTSTQKKGVDSRVSVARLTNIQENIFLPTTSSFISFSHCVL